jgi:hypothetical protein
VSRSIKNKGTNFIRLQYRDVENMLTQAIHQIHGDIDDVSDFEWVDSERFFAERWEYLWQMN